jgi:hypothetical protein
MRSMVAAAAGGGMSHEDIALALGIARNTLEKHFEAELSVGAFKKRMEVLAAMVRAAKAGNVAAQKAYLQLQPKPAAPPLQAPAPAAKPAGKKQQADADAKTAAVGTEWADLLPGSRAPLQ